MDDCNCLPRYPVVAMSSQRDFLLEPDDVERLANLCGPFDEHLRQIELRLDVEIANRGNVFRVTGPEAMAARAERLSASFTMRSTNTRWTRTSCTCCYPMS